MRVLITGGAGYVGSQVALKFARRGYVVSVYDNLSRGREALPLLTEAGIGVTVADVLDKSTLSSAIRETDLILHLAGVVGYPACNEDPVRAWAVNVDGTRNVVTAMHPTQHLVYASSGSVYGRVKGVCTENTPAHPLSLYGRSTLEGERLALDAGGVSLRFATVYGPSQPMRFDLLPNYMTSALLNSGVLSLYEANARRTFIHVQDVADAYVHAVTQLHAGPDIFNVGDPTLSLTKDELGQRIVQALGEGVVSTGFGSDEDQRDYAVSYDKFEATGFKARANFFEGIRSVALLARDVQ